MFDRHAALEQEARRVIEWIKEGQALKDDVQKALHEQLALEVKAKDDMAESREAIRAEVTKDEMAIATKIVELLYKGEFDAAHLWDAFPELWQKSPHLSSALGKMKGNRIRAAAARCVACTACTACVTCGACALCVVTGVAATAGISVTSAVSSTQAYGR
jgi:hypothetical protein